MILLALLILIWLFSTTGNKAICWKSVVCLAVLLVAAGCQIREQLRLEKQLQKIVVGVNKVLPKRVDPMTIAKRMEVDGTTLEMYFQLDGHAGEYAQRRYQEFASQFTDISIPYFRKLACSKEPYWGALQAGATLRWIYVDELGRELGTATFTKDSCSSGLARGVEHRKNSNETRTGVFWWVLFVMWAAILPIQGRVLVMSARGRVPQSGWARLWINFFLVSYLPVGLAIWFSSIFVFDLKWWWMIPFFFAAVLPITVSALISSVGVWILFSLLLYFSGII